MRHGVKLNRLGRKTAHRKALMRNLAIQLIRNKRIVTTLAKAKALRVFIEPLITRSKQDNMNNRRLVFAYLNDKDIIGELFTVVGEKVANRPGGYTRIIKLAPRVGDAADMAMIELVDFNEIYNNGKTADAAKKKTRRSRGAATKKAEVAESTTANVEESKAEAAESVDEVQNTEATSESTEGENSEA